MKVEAIEIRNFRSVASCKLGSCGGLNVLIGKNNSGKSNILSAIDAFFKVVSNGEIVSLDSPINKEVDFYKKNLETPAEITFTFSLSEEERSELMDSIIEDSPRMTNAVENLESSLWLSVRISFNLVPNRYSCVNRISLVLLNEDGRPDPSSEKIILDINQEAALEFHKKYRQYQHDESVIKALLQFLRLVNRDAWDRIRRGLSENISISRLYRTMSPSMSPRVLEDPDVQSIVESVLRNSETYEEFRSTLQAEIDSLTRYTGNSDRHELEQESVETFSGREDAIPKHVLRILQKLSEVKVLNVTDNRRSIGRDEAQKLLNLKTRRGGQDPLKRIQEIVLSLLGVQVDAFSGEETTRRGDISAELDVDDFVVEVNGSGIKEALRLLLDIEFEGPDLLLVEEPEIHLHPALETNMMHYLKEVSQNCQVFITTHSTNFLDAATMENIYLVSKTESTIAQRLNQDEVEEQIPIELGI